MLEISRVVLNLFAVVWAARHLRDPPEVEAWRVPLDWRTGIMQDMETSR